MRNNVSLIQDFKDGLHYKIPLCCIIQWCLETHFPFFNKLFGERNHSVHHYAINKWFWDTRIGYTHIPCTLCVNKWYSTSPTPHSYYEIPSNIRPFLRG